MKAANSTMFPIENTQLEASVTGLNGPHQSVRIDRLHMNDVFEWQVSYTLEDSLAGCSVSLIARFLNATELYPDIRPWQDCGELDGVSSSVSGDQTWSAQNESGGPYLPPLSFKPYKLSAFEFLLPVDVGKSSFQANWSKCVCCNSPASSFLIPQRQPSEWTPDGCCVRCGQVGR